ncbi:MAG: AMP-binding protein [Propionibacteriales bacterium]|nr:AMP-binding protein [Propionibacteriales bacterium]
MGEGTASAQAEQTVLAIGFADDLARHGNLPALHSPDGTITYAALARRIATARAALATVAGPTRQLVRLRPAPTVDFVVAWLASLTAGHVTLLTHNDGLARAYSTSIEYDDHGWRATGARAPELHPDLRLLLSTSGSTGSPKLVRLSAANLDANAAAIASYLGLTSDDVAVTTLPLDYCYGLSVLHSHLSVGASLVLDDRSVTDPGLWAGARRHGVTSFAGVPYTFDLLVAAGWPELPTLRQVTQAGGRMAPERVRALAAQGRGEGWDLYVMYGQTEATARMAYLPPDLTLSHPSAVGVAIPGGSFRIDPVDGADPGVGELVYSGPNVMMGYAESPTDLGAGQGSHDLRTGDLARVVDGMVEIVGRSSRFTKLFGQRIDLDRLQTLLAVSGYDVACVESRDQTHLVVAVPGRPDAAVVGEIAAAAARDTGLPRHALRVVAIDELPRLASGKLDQPAIARLMPVEAAGQDPADLQITRLYARVLGREVVRPDDSFIRLGGDSLSYVELSVRLEPILGTVPANWPELSVADLAARATARPTGPGTRPSTWVRLDTTIALRALAIVVIVGSHTDLWVLLGSAHVLLAVAGANFARFQLALPTSGARVRRSLSAVARIALPSAVWIGTVDAISGGYGWRSVLLLNDLLGGKDWAEPTWHYWFIEVILLFGLGAGLVTAIPRVMLLEQRHRFGVALGFSLLALAPRFWASWTSYDGDVIHSSPFVLWLFALGWAAAVARTVPQRLVVSALLVIGTWDFTGNADREQLIVLGTLALVWLPSVPWPRVLVGATGTLASASLHIYLTHWQIYPHFEQHWPLGGLLASLAFGVLAWHLVQRIPVWTHLLLRAHHRPHYARHDHDRQETR